MKRTVALAILGVAAVNTALGQGGHVQIWNYYNPPYNQVLWDASVPSVGGAPVMDLSVQLSFWIAAGAVGDDSGLIQSATEPFTVNPNIQYNGGGYYDPQALLTPGEGVYTVQLRASGTTPYGPVDEALSRSDLFVVTTVSTSLPAPDSGTSIGLSVIVPEPTTFALAGLGAAALLIFRRRD